MTPRVSVTIPTYNRSAMVKEAIESVLAQTFTDIEVVVVDDGSTDDTRAVVEGIGDNRVKYYYKTNGGCASARNAGLRHCRGDYVSFLDSDDLWPTNFIEVMLKHLEAKPDYGCCYCPIITIHPDGRREDSLATRCYKSGQITNDLFKTSTISIQTGLYRAAAFSGLVFDEAMRNGADTDVLLRLSTRIRFWFVPDVRVLIRVRHNLSPRKDFSSLNCNRARSLERFYYELGGNKFISPLTARRKISHAYRAVAKSHYKQKNKAAALALYGRAIHYWPCDLRLCLDWLKAKALPSRDDPAPSWKLPDRLAEPVAPSKSE